MLVRSFTQGPYQETDAAQLIDFLIEGLGLALIPARREPWAAVRGDKCAPCPPMAHGHRLVDDLVRVQDASKASITPAMVF